MTTIAYDHKNKMIAVDSQISCGHIVHTNKATKYKKDKDGNIWFFCGKVSDEEALINAKNNDTFEVNLGCSAIFIDKNGDAFSSVCEARIVEISKLSDNSAEGSGRDFALSALDFGKSAEEAVKYASTRCLYTGGRVRVFDIKLGKFVK